MKIKIKNIELGDSLPIVLIGGPCVIENESMAFEVAEKATAISRDLGIGYIFKASYKKANRTSLNSFTGIGDLESLKIIKSIGEKFDLPTLTDIHSRQEAKMAAEYVDILQIPAFLCRQTELLLAAGSTNKVVNIKKGQFLNPYDMKYAAEKVASTGNNKILLTERGTTFGYNNLVVDMRSLEIMKETGYPVIMDATHSVQLPGSGGITGGDSRFILPISKAATAVGIHGLFLEIHPEPSKALSDAQSQLKLDYLPELLDVVVKIDSIVKSVDIISKFKSK